MRLSWIACLGVVASTMLACGAGTTSTASVSHTPAASPTPDAYVLLIRNYWTDLIHAHGNAPQVCLNGPINPAQCKLRAEAQLAVQRKFLSDLKTITVPPQFAQPNGVLLANVPKAIADLQAMIAAADTGKEDAVVEATGIYVDQMVPTITDALDEIDPGVKHLP